MGSASSRARGQTVGLTQINEFEGKPVKQERHCCRSSLKHCGCCAIILTSFVVPFCIWLFGTEKATEYRVQDTYGLIGMLLTFAFCIIEAMTLYLLFACYCLNNSKPDQTVRRDYVREQDGEHLWAPIDPDALAESTRKQKRYFKAKGWRSPCGLICSCTSFLIVQALVIVALFGPGRSDYLWEPDATVLIDSRLPLKQMPDVSVGSLPVTEIVYGSGTDKTRTRYGATVRYKTPTVDCTRYFTSKGFLTYDDDILKGRRVYWGFGLPNMPLNAVVYMPNVFSADRYPVVIIAHGDQFMKDGDAELGMRWIARHLASLGFIAVCVDENFLNFGPGGGIMGDDYAPHGARDDLKARGYINLMHANIINKWDSDITSPFYNKVDKDAGVALIGHSRGGGGVGASIEINLQEKLNISLKAVMMLAPFPGVLDKQVTSLPKFYNSTVSTLLMQGSHDVNVIFNVGDTMQRQTRFFNREHPGASPISGNPTVQATVLLQGGNHNNWNTGLGPRDTDDPMARFLNAPYNWQGAPLLSPIEQRNITNAYAGAFMMATLKGRTGYLSVLRDMRVMYEGQWQAIPSIKRMGAATWYIDDQSLLLETFDDGDMWQSRVKSTGFAVSPSSMDPLLRDKLTPTMNKALLCKFTGTGEAVRVSVDGISSKLPTLTTRQGIANSTLTLSIGVTGSVNIGINGKPTTVLNNLCVSLFNNQSVKIGNTLSLNKNALMRPTLEAHIYKFPWNVLVEPMIFPRFYNIALQTYELPLLALLGNSGIDEVTHVEIKACTSFSDPVEAFLDDIAIRPY